MNQYDLDRIQKIRERNENRNGIQVAADIQDLLGMLADQAQENDYLRLKLHQQLNRIEIVQTEYDTLVFRNGELIYEGSGQNTREAITDFADELGIQEGWPVFHYDASKYTPEVAEAKLKFGGLVELSWLDIEFDEGRFNG